MFSRFSRSLEAMLAECADQTAKGDDLRWGKVVGQGMWSVFRSPEVLKTIESKKELTLQTQRLPTDDKIDALCGIVSNAMYSVSGAMVEARDPTPFCLTEEDANKCEQDASVVWATIPSGTILELIDEVSAVTDAIDPEKLINIRHAAVSGYAKKKHLLLHESRDEREALWDAVHESLKSKQHALLKDDVDVLHAQIAPDMSPLVNPMGCVIAKVNRGTPRKPDHKVYALIAWGGTEFAKRPMDLAQDVAAAPAACPLWHKRLPKLHGHAAMLAQIQGQLAAYGPMLERLLLQYSCNTLVFTGHSLGAGCCFLAHMCALCQLYDDDGAPHDGDMFAPDQNVVANQADGWPHVIMKSEAGKGKAVANVPNGEYLKVIQADGQDVKVQWNEKVGWARAANLVREQLSVDLRAPGSYEVLQDNLAVRVSKNCTSELVDGTNYISAGTFVDVVEVAEEGDELRAKIAHPEGWISKCQTDGSIQYVIPRVRWEVLLDDQQHKKEWKPMKKEDSELLEERYQTGVRQYEFTIRNFSFDDKAVGYSINFNEMTQTNMRYNFARKIRRLTGRIDRQLTLESRGFAGPMVFYRAQEEFSKQEEMLLDLFLGNSVNYVVDVDIIPRLPGHTEFARKGLKTVLVSLGAACIMNALPVTDRLQKAAQDIAGQVHDKMLAKNAVQKTEDALQKYEHLSKLMFVGNDGEKVSMQRITCKQYKEDTLEDLLKDDKNCEWQYFLNCHNWLPSNMEYRPTCIKPNCHRPRGVAWNENMWRLYSHCCLNCAKGEPHAQDCGHPLEKQCSTPGCNRLPEHMEHGGRCCKRCETTHGKEHDDECTEKCKRLVEKPLTPMPVPDLSGPSSFPS